MIGDKPLGEGVQQEVSLFIGLVPGTKIELAVAARATLAFDAALKEVAFSIDPFAQISVELENSTEGSQKINALIRSAVGHVTTPGVLLAAAISVGGWFTSDVRSYFTGRILESFLEQEAPSLSQEQIDDIATAVRKSLAGGTAETEMKQVLRELERDEHVTEVGVSAKKDKRPVFTLPKSEFSERIHEPAISPSTGSEVTTKVEKLNLISPVLLPGERRWRFSFHEGEFGAPILDKSFLQRLLSGKEPVEMTAGITMTVLLETRYGVVDGMRFPKERRILEVRDVQRGYRQSRLDL